MSAALTRRTSRCLGYSGFDSRSGYGRGDGAQRSHGPQAMKARQGALLHALDGHRPDRLVAVRLQERGRIRAIGLVPPHLRAVRRGAAAGAPCGLTPAPRGPSSMSTAIVVSCRMWTPPLRGVPQSRQRWHEDAAHVAGESIPSLQLTSHSAFRSASGRVWHWHFGASGVPRRRWLAAERPVRWTARRSLHACRLMRMRTGPV